MLIDRLSGCLKEFDERIPRFLKKPRTLLLERLELAFAVTLVVLEVRAAFASIEQSSGQVVFQLSRIVKNSIRKIFLILKNYFLHKIKQIKQFFHKLSKDKNFCQRIKRI